MCSGGGFLVCQPAVSLTGLASSSFFCMLPGQAEGVDSSAGGAAPSAAAPEEPSAAAEDASNAAGDHAGSEAEGAEEEDLDDDKTLEGPGVDVD